MYIAKHLVSAGSEVAVGSPIMITVENVDDVKAFESYTLSASSTAAASPKKETKTSPAPTESPTPSPAAPEVKSSSSPTTPQAKPVSPPPQPPSKASTPTPPKAASSASPAPVPANSAPSGSWGQHIYKSPILQKLIQEQSNHLSKYGGSLHQPLKKTIDEK